VSHLTDKSDNGQLPDDALNPLVNPLLAANMGRWAEVYFTNPPERRVQAVTDLIRELETSSKAVTRGGSEPGAENARPVRPAPRAAALTAPPRRASSDVVCSGCRQDNPEGQRFCGMCGRLLQTAHQEESRGDGEAEATAWANHESADVSSYPESEGYADRADDNIESADEPDGRFEFAPLAVNDLPSFARESDPVPYRHRIYIGLIVGIVLAALIYLARFRTEVFSGDEESPAARAIPAAQSASETTEPSTAQPSPPVEKVDRNESTPATVQSTKQTAPQPQRKQEAVPPPRTEPSPAITASTSGGASGAGELAEAQKYLSGNQLNSGEAVPWLWKAVAKGNAGATVTLADLYLRGVGVAKNCDQGRLLLDVAAKKGATGAAEQLRNLQAFGCR
jgi:hypothetical protein